MRSVRTRSTLDIALILEQDATGCFNPFTPETSCYFHEELINPPSSLQASFGKRRRIHMDIQRVQEVYICRLLLRLLGWS